MILEIICLLLLTLCAILYFGLKDISKAIRNPKDVIKRNLLGQVQKAQIVKKKDDIDSLLND